MAGLGVVAALARRSPPASALELVAPSAATFKASRTLSKEKLASFVRQPSVEGVASLGEDERPTGEGLQRALSARARAGRIIGQSRRPGTRLAHGARVNVVVSRGMRR